MSVIDKLKIEIGKLYDPGFKKTFDEVSGVKNIEIDNDNVVRIELYLKNRFNDEFKVKREIAKIVKIDFKYPGLTVEFYDSTYKDSTKKEITYIAIASGKGGVGKSTVTANLAVQLKKLGKTVGIIDADVYGSSIPLILDIKPRPLDIDEDEYKYPINKNGIEVIATNFFMPPNKPLMWRGPMLAKLLIHFFNDVRWNEETDIILIDLPPGTGDVQLDVNTFVPKSSLIVVTTPEVNASNVAIKAGIGAKEIGHDVIGVVENMSYYYNPCSKENDYIFGRGGGQQVANELKVPLLGQIPIGITSLENSYIYEDEEIQAKMYQLIAKEIIKKFNI